MYSKFKNDEPIRQGDIFRLLPRIELLLGDGSWPYIYELSDKDGEKEIDWKTYAQTGKNEPKLISVSLKSSYGIVISQDCDASRNLNIAFAEIKQLNEIDEFKDLNEDVKPKTVINVVTDHTRKNQKWYYLSENKELGFSRKMCVDFESIFEINRNMLEKNIELLRLGRLEDEVAWPHFRERIAEYFRRYPYNEWYPLNSEETQYYEEVKKRKNPEFKLEPKYSWQISKPN